MFPALSDFPSLPRVGRIEDSRAYGQSGNEPLFGQKFHAAERDREHRGLAGPRCAGVGTVGSKSLHPERQREFEAGTDMTFAGGRGLWS